MFKFKRLIKNIFTAYNNFKKNIYYAGFKAIASLRLINFICYNLKI